MSATRQRVGNHLPRVTNHPNITLGTLLGEALWRWPADQQAESELLREICRQAAAALPQDTSEAAREWVLEVSCLGILTTTERAVLLARGLRLLLTGELSQPEGAPGGRPKGQPDQGRTARESTARESTARSQSEKDAPAPEGHLRELPVPSPSFALTRLKGCGPRTAERLAARGIREPSDLLEWLPSAYEDRRQVLPLSQVVPGQAVLTIGRVVSQGYRGRSGRRFYEMRLEDGEAQLVCRWFRAWPGLASAAPPDARVLVSGMAREYKGMLQMAHPTLRVPGPEDEDEDLAEGVVPRYPPIEGVAPATLRKLCAQVAGQAEDLCPEPLPHALGERLGLPGRAEAFGRLHLPDPHLSDAEVEALQAGQSDAHRRLVFDALFLSQLALAHRRRQVEVLSARPCQGSDLPPGLFPFALTHAQERVIGEIAGDLTRGTPMQRLVQGDVGSGKTAVAFAAAAQVIAAGGQVAFMAPTEILAAQHHATLTPWMKRLGHRLALLTASTPRGVRESTLALLAAGRLPLVVGTHALLADRVSFAELALVIVDEQHRFGVAQRARLREKGGPRDQDSPGQASRARSGMRWSDQGAEAPGPRGARRANTAEYSTDEQRSGQGCIGGLSEQVISEWAPSPHLLVMTATPIPRTLALAVYGDLDLSVVDELPPGRVCPTTHVFPVEKRAKVYERVLAHLREGRRAFVVCPLVEESEALRLADAESTFADLTGRLAPHPVGLLHGRLPSDEKTAVLEDFRAGRTKVLVATTVVEVGVDIPDAEIMVVESAQRFGLAQLHQLRGRVGRQAGAEALCLLIPDGEASGEARRRLQVMVDTTDGFRIAEEDLKLRGPGELLGLCQAGGQDLGLTGAAAHPLLLAEARQAAREVIQADPQLLHPQHAVARQLLGARFTGRIYGEETG